MTAVMSKGIKRKNSNKMEDEEKSKKRKPSPDVCDNCYSHCNSKNRQTRNNKIKALKSSKEIVKNKTEMKRKNYKNGKMIKERISKISISGEEQNKTQEKVQTEVTNETDLKPKKKKFKGHEKTFQKKVGVKNSTQERSKPQKFPSSLQEKLLVPPKCPAEFSSNWKQFLQTSDFKNDTQHSSKKNAMKNITSKKRKKMDSGKLKEEKDGQKTDKNEPDIWFDDVDEALIDHKVQRKSAKEEPLVKRGSFTGLTRAVAMDCEMVGTGEDGKDNMLARVSIVNQNGNCVYDTFVKPMELVTDYRTHVSGVRREDLKNGKIFTVVQKEVSEIMRSRVLVGHAIQNDLKVLYLSHPRHQIRDTQRYKPFRQLFQGKYPSLKKLCDKVLGVQVQQGEHSSIQDAQAAMRLYTMHKQKWEKDIKFKARKHSVGKKQKHMAKGSLD